MPEDASTGVGAPEVQMLLASWRRPEPAWQRPMIPPMSPIPGTLPMLPGAVVARSLACCCGVCFAVCAAGAAALAGAAASACAAGAAAAAGAACTAGAAFAERDRKSPLNTIARIALVSSRARAGRHLVLLV